VLPACLRRRQIERSPAAKHREIANFTEAHCVNLEWLLEGRGPIFKKDIREIVRAVLDEELAPIDQEA
jgi:hypothetical protein